MPLKRVVVVNRREAKIFAPLARTDTTPESLKFVSSLKNVADAEINPQLVRRADSPPPESGHGVSRHSLEPWNDPHEIAVGAFMVHVAKFLDCERASGRLSEIVVIAEPHSIGLLKASLTTPTDRIVSRWIIKDLTHATIDELAATIAL